MRLSTLIPVLVLSILVPCVVVGVVSYLRDNNEKNRIQFPEQGIDVQCPATTPRFNRSGFLLADFFKNPVKETGCAGKERVVGNVYGYDESTGTLIYEAKMEGGHLKNITFYARHDPRSNLSNGVVQECGNRTVSIGKAPFSYTYAFPCTDEVGAVPTPEGATVTMSTLLVHEYPLSLRYEVSCGTGCEYTVKMVDLGVWRIVP